MVSILINTISVSGYSKQHVHRFTTNTEPQFELKTNLSAWFVFFFTNLWGFFPTIPVDIITDISFASF